MKLHELLIPDHISLDFAARDCESIINHLVDLLADTNSIDNRDLAKKLVLERERQVGTGIGYGVAIPHTEPGPFPSPQVAFGRLVSGINFQAPDGSKARLVFLLLTPASTPALHVRLLARICRLLKSEGLRKRLLEAPNPQTAAAVIAEAETDFPELTP